MSSKLRIEFHFDKAFPAGDPVASWILALAWVRNDVAEAHRMMAATSDDAPRFVYYFRLATAHFREAVKMLAKVGGTPLIQVFVDNLPTPAKADYAAVSSLCNPWNGSFVKDVVVPIRNACFHYPTDSPDLAKFEASMTAVGPNVTGIVVDDDGGWRAAFADEVAFKMGLPGYDEQHFRIVVDRLQDGVLALIRFVDAAIITYLDALPAGVVAKGT